MWLWVAVGVVVYAALILLVFSLARSATVADRSERQVFRARLGERARAMEDPILRGERPRKAA